MPRALGGLGLVVAVVAVGAGTLGCRKQPSKPHAAPAPPASTALPAPVASGLAIPADVVAKVVNSSGRPPYAGPTASVKGVVRAVGDAAPEDPEAIRQIPAECDLAREAYSKIFRTGPKRELADALVTVTGYEAYVPERVAAVPVEARGCFWGSRTFAITFGQRLEVASKDRRPYVPDLIGGKLPAQIIAMPGGAPSAIYPNQPGRYVLIDSMRIFAMAEVYVLKYPTHSVTGLDGRYEITGIPPGKDLKLTAFSPQTGEVLEKTITLVGGQSLEMDFELPFSLQKHAENRAKAGPAAASAAPRH
ncbi:MAG: carboxypeptidase-like regulatory domain-containing protein [Myxococcota bacterium]|nr:carboxypeptidase-like regulatory domain-containing protein [Myxococcota bacterium]